LRGSLAVRVVAATLAALAVSQASASSGPLRGTYRALVTARSLRAVGVPAQEATFDAGTWTLTLGPGRWTMRQAGGPYGNAFAEGALKLSAGRALLTLERIDGVPHHEFAGAVRWRASGRSLRFARSGVANIYELYVLVAQPWRRTA